MKKKIHVHFMGIGGSALAGVAVLAKAAGFEVSGCDLEAKTYYSPLLKKAKIKYLIGHSVDHLENVDIVAASPAVYLIKSPPQELIEARKRKILISWQEFQGQFLQKGKEVLAVAGTHGKSTVTAMLGLALESAGFDPTVEVGAVVPQWQATFRIGHSRFFVCEADEFNFNFLHYEPGLIIINNVEMDHPEFFKNEEEFLAAFVRFIKKIKPPKILVVNEEDKGLQKIISQSEKWLLANEVKVVGFFLKQKFDFPFTQEYQGEILKQTTNETRFKVSGPLGEEVFVLKVPGLHQVFNALAVIATASVMKADLQKIKKALFNFQNLGRRFDLIGEKSGIKVFDDYAVHPSAVEATLKAARQKYPHGRIWAIFEPHQFSRLKLFLNEFAQTLKKADRVIVTTIFPGREEVDPQINSQDLVAKIGKKALFMEKFPEIAQKISQEAKPGDTIIVFGAGKSYLLSRMILERLK